MERRLGPLYEFESHPLPSIVANFPYNSCPTTGLEVITGLEMDFDTFADLPSVLPDIRCPHCPKPHQLCHVAARLVEGVRRTDEAALGEAATL